MAGEIAVHWIPNVTVYSQIRERLSGGLIWNGAAWESYNSASGNLASYPIALAMQGSASAHYVGNMPATVPAGTYDVSAFQKQNAYYSEADLFVGAGQVEWNGGKAVPLSDLSTSGQVGLAFPLRPARGVMIPNFGVYFRSTADQTQPITSGVVSGQIARDGGVFGPLQSGLFLEMGNGWYNLSGLTSGDLLANNVKLIFTCANPSGGIGVPVNMSILLQKTSGQ